MLSYVIRDNHNITIVELRDFENKIVKTEMKTAGQSLKMICSRPSSLPEAQIIWTKNGRNIDYNDRVVIDPDGKSVHCDDLSKESYSKRMLYKAVVIKELRCVKSTIVVNCELILPIGQFLLLT